MPPPVATSSCVHAAPSVEANALRSRQARAVAAVRTMRWSPLRRARSAANSSASLSSSATVEGSISNGERPVAARGGDGRQRRGGAGGLGLGDRQRTRQRGLGARRG